jgi:hypothetical protein
MTRNNANEAAFYITGHVGPGIRFLLSCRSPSGHKSYRLTRLGGPRATSRSDG